jgi:hypothetical protein
MNPLILLPMKKIVCSCLAIFCLQFATSTFAQDAPDLSVVLKDNFNNTIDFKVSTSLIDMDGNYVFDLISADIDFGDGSIDSYSADANESVFVSHSYVPGVVYTTNVVAVFSDTTIITTFPVEIGLCSPGNQPVTFGLHDSLYIGEGSIEVYYPRMDNTTWSFTLDNSDPLSSSGSFCLPQDDCRSIYMEGALAGYANVFCIGADEFPLSPDPMFPHVQLCPDILCLNDITEISSGIGYVELNVNQTNCPSVNWYINGEMQSGHAFTETLYFPTDGYYTIMVTDTCADCNQAVSTLYQVEGGNVFLIFSNAEEMENSASVQLYPNPVNEILNCNSNSPIASVEVYDNAGRMILKESNIYTASHSMDFKGFESGMYLVKITDVDGRTSVRQVVK